MQFGLTNCYCNYRCCRAFGSNLNVILYFVSVYALCIVASKLCFAHFDEAIAAAAAPYRTLIMHCTLQETSITQTATYSHTKLTCTCIWANIQAWGMHVACSGSSIKLSQTLFVLYQFIEICSAFI